jgi:anti-sigma B factor antagonist
MARPEPAVQVNSWIEVSERGATLVLRIGGELDSATHTAMLPTVAAAISSARSVVLDLSALTFCDSSGIAMFVDAHKKAAEDETSLVIRHPRPAVRRLIEITGVDSLIPIEYQHTQS